jgi:hypothetical protein
MRTTFELIYGRQSKWRMLSRLLLALLALKLSLSALPAAARPATPQTATPATPATPAGREIYIPAEELPLLLQSWPSATMISREEFLRLQAANEAQEEARPPHAALLQWARHRIVVEEERAFWSCQAQAEALAAGQQTLSLPTTGIIWTHLASQDQPLPASADAAGNGVNLLLSGPSRVELFCQGELSVNNDAASRSMTLSLPPAAVATLDLQVPGDVAMRAGPTVLARHYDPDKKLTLFELRPAQEETTIVLTLNNRFKQDESLVYATAQLATRLLEAGEQLQALIDFDIRHQALPGCQVQLPPGFELIEVTGSGAATISEWSLSPERVLSMRFVTPQQGRVAIQLSLFRASADLSGAWSFPLCRPLGCQQVHYHPSVEIVPALNLSALQSQGFLHLPAARMQAPSATAANLEDGSTAAVRINGFAPADFSLEALISKRTPSLTSTLDSRLRVDEDAMRCELEISLRAELEACFQIALAVPEGWQLAKTDAPAKPPADAGVVVASQLNERHELIIRFPNGVWPEQPFQFTLAFSCTPARWRDAWDAPREQPFPIFRVLDAREQQGSLALLPLPPGFQAELSLAERCRATQETNPSKLGAYPFVFVYAYRDPSCRLILSYRRATPRLRAETYSLFQAHSDHLAVTHELQFAIERAPLRELSFLLPSGTPKGFSVISARPALPGVKEYSQQESADGMLGKVILEREANHAHLLIRYELPFQNDGLKEPLPLIQAQAVAYQSGRIAVEGGAELDVSINDAPRSIDVGELAAFVSQPGKRLLGVYAYTNKTPAMTLDVKRQAVHALPAALTANCEADMVLSPRGVAQLAVNYALLPNVPALILRLPAEARLWAVTLDQQPATAQRSGQDARDILLPIPPPMPSLGKRPASTTRLLSVTYELSTSAFVIMGRSQAALPELCYRSDDGITHPVPTADLRWRVYYPENYQLLSYAGKVSMINRHPDSPIVPAVGRFLYRCTGGLNPAHGCIGIALWPVLSAARAKALAANKLSAGYMVSDVEIAQEETSGVVTERVDLGADRARSLKRPSKMRPSDALTDGDASFAVPATSKIDWLTAEATRSLNIAIASPGTMAQFRNLGENPQLSVTLLNRAALRNVTRGLLLLLICCGLSPYFHGNWRRKLGYVSAWLLLCGVLPCIPALAAGISLFNQLFLAALFLLACYFCWALGSLALTSLLRRYRRFLAAIRPKVPAVAKASTMMMLILFLSALTAQAQAANPTPANPAAAAPSALEALGAATPAPSALETPAAATVAAPAAPFPTKAASASTPATQPLQPVQLIAPEALVMPSDAVIVPYRGTPQHPTGNLLLPYDYYQHLLRGAAPTPPKAQQALFSAAQYRCLLRDGDSLLIEATLHAHLPAHGPTTLPLLRYRNAIIGDLLINGQTASAWLSDDGEQQSMGIYLPQAGDYQISFTLRSPISRQGGWRNASLALPAPGPAALRIETSQADCELVFKSPRLNWTRRCAEPASVLQSATDGSLFNLQWRAVAASHEIDPTLVVQSTAFFKISEAALELFWQPSFQLQSQDRSVFELEFPSSYQLKALKGENVRGWESHALADRTRVSVHLLKPAVKKESFALHLLADGPGVHPPAQTLPFPTLTVAGAARHQLSLLVDRHCGFEVRAEAAASVRRVEPTLFAETLADLSGYFSADFARSAIALATPLEAWQFSGRDEPLRFHCTAYKQGLDAVVRLIWQLAADGQHLEGRLLLKTGRRFQPTLSLRLPGKLDFYSVSGSDLLAYQLAPNDDGSQNLELQLRPRKSYDRDYELHFAARSNEVLSAEQSIALPQIRVIDADSQQTDLAIQCPPLFQLHEEQLNGVEALLRESFAAWLPPTARALSTLTLRAKQADYQGRIAIRQKPCVVTGFCLNSRSFTPTALEESTLFDLHIDGALSEFSFSSEPHLADALIEAPALRSQRIEPSEDGKRLRFTLLFQDALSGNVRILLRHDRPAVDDELQVAVPQCELPLKHYLVIENRSRDEINCSKLHNASPLDRSRNVPPILQPLLSGHNLQLFDLKDDSAELLCSVHARQTVSTAGARIGLASSLLMLDPQGQCRGELTLQVDNRSEQFLIINMPENATLWTAKVAGELIKPIIAEEQAGRRIWIPLVKTAEGDLDYQVVLKYAATLPAPSLLRSLSFPLIKVDNINVERSQLSLRLPREYHWLHFRGSFGEPTHADSYQAVQLDYQSSVAKRLNAALQSSDMYTQQRAMSRIKEFNVMVEQSQLGAQGAAPQAALQQTQQAMSVLNQQMAVISQQQHSQHGDSSLKSYFSTLNSQQSIAFANASRQEDGAFQLTRDSDEFGDARDGESQAMDEIAKCKSQVRWKADKPIEPLFARGKQEQRQDEQQMLAGRAEKAGELGRREAAAALPEAPSGMDRKPAGGGMGMDGMGAAPAIGDMQVTGEIGAGMGRDSRSGLRPQAAPAPAAALASQLSVALEPSAAEALTPELAARLASLDVALADDDPSRWQSFFFSAPRDADVLRCRAIDQRFLTGLRQFAYVLLTALVLGAAAMFYTRKGLKALPTKLRSRGLLLQIAAVSIIFGVFPLLGLTLLLLGLLMPRQSKNQDPVS